MANPNEIVKKKWGNIFPHYIVTGLIMLLSAHHLSGRKFLHTR